MVYPRSLYYLDSGSCSFKQYLKWVVPHGADHKCNCTLVGNVQGFLPMLPWYIFQAGQVLWLKFFLFSFDSLHRTCPCHWHSNMREVCLYTLTWACSVQWVMWAFFFFFLQWVLCYQFVESNLYLGNSLAHLHFFHRIFWQQFILMKSGLSFQIMLAITLLKSAFIRFSLSSLYLICKEIL